VDRSFPDRQVVDGKCPANRDATVQGKDALPTKAGSREVIPVTSRFET
jgi:hypothetical protein